MKSYLTPKVDSILKRSNSKATTQITHVFRTKVKMFTPSFGRWILIVRTRVGIEPAAQRSAKVQPFWHLGEKKMTITAASSITRSSRGCWVTRVLYTPRLELVRHVLWRRGHTAWHCLNGCAFTPLERYDRLLFIQYTWYGVFTTVVVILIVTAVTAVLYRVLEGY